MPCSLKFKYLLIAFAEHPWIVLGLKDSVSTFKKYPFSAEVQPAGSKTDIFLKRHVGKRDSRGGCAKGHWVFFTEVHLHLVFPTIQGNQVRAYLYCTGNCRIKGVVGKNKN